MDLADQIVGRNGDDGKCANPLPTLWVTPVLPKPSDGKGPTVLRPKSGSSLLLANLPRWSTCQDFLAQTLIMVPHILDGRCPVSVSRLRQTR